MEKKILLIGDLVGYGRLALTAQIPLLSSMGYMVCNLPTALVSNNFCYGRYAMLDTTDYMRDTLSTWCQLGFSFDAIAVGFIATHEQAQILTTFCQQQREQGTRIFVDPIMGDEGTLYKGIGPETVQHLQKAVAVSDVTVPNYTEACYLTGIPYHEEGMTTREAEEVVERMRQLGACSILITSARVEGKPTVVCYNHHTNRLTYLPYTEVPVIFSGTGDVFSSFLIGKILDNVPLEEAARATISELYMLIHNHRDCPNKQEGLPI